MTHLFLIQKKLLQKNIVQKMASRDDLFFLARLAEQADRYDDTFKYMMKVVDDSQELKEEEIELLRSAFNIVYKKQEFMVQSLEELMENEKRRNNIKRFEALYTFRTSVAEDLKTVYLDLIQKIKKFFNQNLCKKRRQIYLTLIGDCYAFLGKLEYLYNELALQAFEEAWRIAKSDMVTVNVQILRTALNYSEFLSDRDQPISAIHIAKYVKKNMFIYLQKAFDWAISEIDSIDEKDYKDCIMLLSTLRDNLHFRLQFN